MTDYWHGGPRGIRVGDLLRSRRELGIKEDPLSQSIRSYLRIDDDPKRVYFTTDRDLARAWAAEHHITQGGGSLYRVRPAPPASLESDPDYPGVGFSARRAQVLEVAEDLVTMSFEDARRVAFVRYQRWTDDSPMYDQDGQVLPPPEHRALGVTVEDYRKLKLLPRWFTFPPEIGLYGKQLVIGQQFLDADEMIRAKYEAFHAPLLAADEDRLPLTRGEWNTNEDGLTLSGAAVCSTCEGGGCRDCIG